MKVGFFTSSRRFERKFFALTLEGGLYVFLEHPLHNLSDLPRLWLPHARVHVLLGHIFAEGKRCGLQGVERTSHVALGELDQRVQAFRGQANLLLLGDRLHSRQHLLALERGEPKASAARLDRRDQLRQVVADEAEARVFGELLNHWNGKAFLQLDACALVSKWVLHFEE